VDLSYALAGALTGFVVGLTGVGGGALMTPLLVLLFGISPTTAIATDLWFAAITKIVGARLHHTAGQVDWQVVRRMWAGSLPVALLVVCVIALGNPVSQLGWLTKAIGAVVIVTALGMLLAPRLVAAARRRSAAADARYTTWQPALTVLGGAVLGVCVALTSVGAGALGSVMLLYLYPVRMTPHRLVATDLVHAIPLAMVAGLGYLVAGMVQWPLLGNLLLGSVPAVLLGSLLARRLAGRWLQVALGCVLLAVGAKTLL
jgi:uncharacterized membrane protein YfcA